MAEEFELKWEHRRSTVLYAFRTDCRWEENQASEQKELKDKGGKWEE